MRVISDLKVTYNLSDLNGMSHTKQLKDGEYNDGNFFQRSCHAYT